MKKERKTEPKANENGLKHEKTQKKRKKKKQKKQKSYIKTKTKKYTGAMSQTNATLGFFTCKSLKINTIDD